MRRTKKVLKADEPFLKTAAAAIGTALGRLAVKTGVATPLQKPAKKPPSEKRTAAPLKRKKTTRKTVSQRGT